MVLVLSWLGLKTRYIRWLLLFGEIILLLNIRRDEGLLASKILLGYPLFHHLLYCILPAELQLLSLLSSVSIMSLLKQEKKHIMLAEFSDDNDKVIDCKWCLCLPKAELKR